MKTIKVRDEDYEFLKELQHELNTQTHDYNADPVYWGVEETMEECVPEGCGDPKIYWGDGVIKDFEESVNDIPDHIYGDEKAEASWEELCDGRDSVDLAIDWDEVVDFIKLYIEPEARTVYVEDKHHISRMTGAFLTKRDCQEYIKEYGYNHSRPHTFAMTAYRNFELGNLLTVLKTMEFGDEKER